jgi:hypothetical protein
MKHITLTVLMVTLGVAGVNAQQDRPVKMRFSGTNVATTITLQPNTVTDEHHSAVSRLRLPEPLAQQTELMVALEE